MATTNALSKSFLHLGFVVLAAFLASCGDGAAAVATKAGTVRVKDINPGTGRSRPFGATIFNNAVYFSAFDAAGGFELWRSDGTEAGTVRVKDINPGAN